MRPSFSSEVPSQHTTSGLRAVTPDCISLLRLGMIPVLWLTSFFANPTLLGGMTALAALTDVVDGPLARRTGRATRRGSQLDSIADHLLTLSLAGWLILFRPWFVAAEWPWLLTWFGTGVTALLAGGLKFGRFGDLHLYSAKAAGTVAYITALWLLTFGTYNPTLFHAVAALGILAALEHLLVVLTRTEVDERIGSIILRNGRRVRIMAESSAKSEST